MNINATNTTNVYRPIDAHPDRFCKNVFLVLRFTYLFMKYLVYVCENVWCVSIAVLLLSCEIQCLSCVFPNAKKSQSARNSCAYENRVCLTNRILMRCKSVENTLSIWSICGYWIRLKYKREKKIWPTKSKCRFRERKISILLMFIWFNENALFRVN